MINLYGLEITKLEQEMLSRNQKKFRATQLYSWIYGKNAQNFDDMSDISKSFIDGDNVRWVASTCGGVMASKAGYVRIYTTRESRAYRVAKKIGMVIEIL